MNYVAIVGDEVGTRNNAPWFNKEFDIWSMNPGAMQRRRLDVAFQIHEPERYLCKGELYINWLKNLKIPLYMNKQRPEFPTSIAYPYEKVFELLKNIKVENKKVRYFTSSFPYMIALAILQKRQLIEVYGVELMIGTEYTDQRDCFAFWIGFAAGKGIHLDIKCAGNIFHRKLYN